MDYVSFGKSNLKVSRLCLGAMGFGAKSWRDWVLEADEAAPVIDRALSHGINFFDTCDFYSAGESERILGQTVLKHHPRDSVVIATKAGNPMAGHPNGRGFSRKHLFKAIDDSLQRLGTDHVDLFQTHIWHADTDIDELVGAMADIVRAGKALYVGAATMPAWAFTLCRETARRRNLPAFLSMQCELNPAHRECERELLPYARHEGLATIPFSPMGRGFLSADRRDPGQATARTKSDDYTTKHYYRAADFAVQQVLAEIAAERRATASQIALAWTLQRPGVTAPIFGATSQAQVDEAVAAMDITLSNDEIARIDETYAPRPLSGGGH